MTCRSERCGPIWCIAPLPGSEMKKCRTLGHWHDWTVLGVWRMSVPNKKTTSSERKLLQHQRWFRNGQKWRTGSEGRISVLKRRHGLRRCLYPGLDGMRRWVECYPAYARKSIFATESN